MKNLPARTLPILLSALFLCAISRPASADEPSHPQPANHILFKDDFSGEKEEVWKEPKSVPGRWYVNSGTLHLRPGFGWTGDLSDPMENSQVFRLLANPDKPLPKDYEVHFRIKVNRVCSEKPEDWHGVHVFLRYRDQFNLYYASIFRADGRIVIKKKLESRDHRAEGTENGGYYYPLSPYTQISNPLGKPGWHNVAVGIQGTPAEIWMKIDGQEVLRAKDSEKIGDPSLTAARPPLLIEEGTTGLRGDYTDFEFSSFEVVGL